ncbi:hypothetical protein BRC76_04720 [Halobacteriales archaeon QH_8_67_36]|nr:MAG: hypothetical protein BRC76_04720 [Halobacteriales archaeon QH_8_67_36]
MTVSLSSFGVMSTAESNSGSSYLVSLAGEQPHVVGHVVGQQATATPGVGWFGRFRRVDMWVCT